MVLFVVSVFACCLRVLLCISFVYFASNFLMCYYFGLFELMVGWVGIAICLYLGVVVYLGLLGWVVLLIILCFVTVFLCFVW